MKAVLRTPPDAAALARLSDSPYHNALMRTTCVATRLEGGHADNALPQMARATVNCRILPGTPAGEVQATLAKVVADDAITITSLAPAKPSSPSPLQPDVMGPVEEVTGEMWPGVPVLPMMGGRDGRPLPPAGGHPRLRRVRPLRDVDDNRAHGRDERGSSPTMRARVPLPPREAAVVRRVKVHLVDGTYELFRSLFRRPRATSPPGARWGDARPHAVAARPLDQPDVTHVACAFDHVIESFRNGLYDGYKTSAGVPRDLLAQFELAERATHALGMVVWPMVEFEADDALATAAARFGDAPEVEQVVICTPDKDLAQCVRGTRVVMLDRRRRIVLDEDAVKAKFGVLPESMPDWLALVGDSSDGYPGLPGWGPKTAAALLTRYRRLEDIPSLEEGWGVSVAGRAERARSCAQAADAPLSLAARLRGRAADGP